MIDMLALGPLVGLLGKIIYWGGIMGAPWLLSYLMGKDTADEVDPVTAEKTSRQRAEERVVVRQLTGEHEREQGGRLGPQASELLQLWAGNATAGPPDYTNVMQATFDHDFARNTGNLVAESIGASRHEITEMTAPPVSPMMRAMGMSHEDIDSLDQQANPYLNQEGLF